MKDESLLIRLRQVAAWPIYLIALILDYVSVALGAAWPLWSPATTGRDRPLHDSRKGRW